MEVNKKGLNWISKIGLGSPWMFCGARIAQLLVFPEVFC
jgi:hypothetical protein